MSIIFYYDSEQKHLAEETLADEQKNRFFSKIKTKVIPMEKFYDAEGYVFVVPLYEHEHFGRLFRFRYHQKYLLQQHPALLKAIDMPAASQVSKYDMIVPILPLYIVHTPTRIFSMQDLITSHLACKLNGYVAGFGSQKDFESEKQQLGLNNQISEYVWQQWKSNRVQH